MSVLPDITEAEGQFLFYQSTYFVSCSQSFNMISFFKHLSCCCGSSVIFLTESPSHSITQLDKAGSCKKCQDPFSSFSIFLMVECITQTSSGELWDMFIAANIPILPGFLLYFKAISQRPPVFLFLPGKSHNFHRPLISLTL